MSEDRRTGSQGNSSDLDRAKRSSPRRPYTTPSLVEYGSIARLTHTGGSTAREGSTPRVRAGCL
jgi:hypothetical protein